MNIEKIEKYYDLEKEKYSNYYKVRKKETENWKTINPHNFTYFTYEYKPSSIEEAEELVKKGLIDKVEGKEFYKEYAKLDKEELSRLIYNMDYRSYKYIEKIKKNIGLIEIIGNYDELDEKYKIEKISELHFWDMTRDVYLYKLKNGNYATQYCIRTDIDDYCVVKYFFNRKPSKKNFETVVDLEEITNYLFNNSPVFNCWECGAETHWTEIQGDLSMKLQCLKDEYCNNC